MADKKRSRRAAKQPAAPRAEGARAVIPVVGVGASAGGLEAFSDLLAHLSPTTGLAFVLVQHLDPTHKSLLTEILARTTALPVTEAVDGLELAADHVYVTPANHSIVLVGNRLRLAPRKSGKKGHRTVDEFLCSLARERGHEAIGVVLSGTGNDGAAGIAAIMAAGGVVFAQSKASSRFDGMPAAAIDAGADSALPPDQIASELLAVAGRHGAARGSKDPAAGAGDEGTRAVCSRS